MVMEDQGVREFRGWVEGLKSCVEAVERWGKNISGEIKEVVGREAERRLAEDASPDGTST